MSKITKDRLTRTGTGCYISVPIWQQWASKGSPCTIGYTVTVNRHHVTTLIPLPGLSRVINSLLTYLLTYSTSDRPHGSKSFRKSPAHSRGSLRRNWQ